MIPLSAITLSADRVQMGHRLLISIQRQHPGVTHSLSFVVKGKKVFSLAPEETSYTWQVPDYSDLCLNELEAGCQVICNTFLAGERQGQTSAWVTLTLPPPAGTAVKALTLGTYTAIPFTGMAKGFRGQVTLRLGNKTWDLGRHKGSDFGWLPPYEIAREFPALVETTGELVTETYNGTAYVGATTEVVKLTVPENEDTRPRLVSAALSPTGQIPAPFDTLFIRGLTGIRAEVRGESDYSAIAYGTLRIRNRLAAGKVLELELLDDFGDVEVEVGVKDQRGFWTRETRKIRICPYERPRLLPLAPDTRVLCERADSAGQVSPRGTFLAIRAIRRFSELTAPNGEKNSCEVAYRYKGTEDRDFSPWIPLPAGAGPQERVQALISGVVTDTQRSYTAQLRVIDRLGMRHQLSFPIMTEAISFVLYDGVDGAAFGKYPESPHVVDLAGHMTLRVRGKLLVEGEDWQDLGLGAGVSPSVFSQGRQETGCFLKLTCGHRVEIAFNCSLEGAPRQVNRDLIPQALRPHRRVSSFCPAEGGGALVTVTPEGSILVEGLLGVSFAGWVDGWLSYEL